MHLLGLAAQQLGRPREAAELLGRAAGLKPDSDEIQANLGLVLLGLGRGDDAVVACRRAVSLRPSAANYAKLAQALSAAGQLDEAIHIYRQYTTLNPQDPAGYFNLANTLNRKGDFEAAIAAYRQAIALNPQVVEAHANMATAMKSAGRLDDAIATYRQAIAIRPQLAGLHYNLGIALHEKGRKDESIDAYRRAITLDPRLAAAHCNLGTVLNESGRADEAIDSFRRAISINPNYAEAYSSLGTALAEKGALDDALGAHRTAVSLRPDIPEVQNNFANALNAKGQLDQAIAHYRAAIELNPNYAEAHYNLGNALHKKGELDVTIDSYQRALDLRPNYVEALSNLGNVLDDKGDLERAIAAYQRAIAIRPDYAQAHNNLGTVLQALGRYDEAAAAFRRAIEFDPDPAKAHFHLGILLLLRGDFEQGWPEYEWRWKFVTSPPISVPFWHGEALDGRTLLVHAEQGFGDTIQFARYAPMIAARGGRVILECQRELHALLARMPGIGRVIAKGETRPEFDLHCPLLSLPFAFGTTLSSIPAAQSYLMADPELVAVWKDRIAGPESFKVGLVWAGSQGHRNDRNRSMKLADLAPLGEIDGITFHSLQKGPPAAQINSAPGRLRPTDLDAQLSDFDQTAALIANLDLVISVDTSVAHLAAALGKPVWLLTPFVPDWRWLLNRADSPWYPTLRLFRQTSRARWDGVIATVAEALARESTRRPDTTLPTG